MSRIDADFPLAALLGNTKISQPNHINMVLEKGIGVAQTRDFLETAGRYVTHWKLGFGTSVFCDAAHLKRKTKLIRDYGATVFPGGTCFEVMLAKGNWMAYFSLVKDLGFNGIEISDGSLDVPEDVRRTAIAKGRELGFTVLTEVGKKDPAHQLSAEQALSTLHADIGAGADYVILEARESGRAVGIFDENGDVRIEQFKSLVAGIARPLLPRVIWEAPLKSQQVFLIRELGPAVNLGNLRMEEVLAVESLRHGLRWETIHGV
ncbi:MAG: phosphosulfolactate synthase [Bdellovibrionales bacterium]